MSENCLTINVSLRYTQTLNLVSVPEIFFFCSLTSLLLYCVLISDFFFLVRIFVVYTRFFVSSLCFSWENSAENINNFYYDSLYIYYTTRPDVSAKWNEINIDFPYTFRLIFVFSFIIQGLCFIKLFKSLYNVEKRSTFINRFIVKCNQFSLYLTYREKYYYILYLMVMVNYTRFSNYFNVRFYWILLFYHFQYKNKKRCGVECVK